MSGSASFQSVRKSQWAVFALPCCLPQAPMRGAVTILHYALGSIRDADALNQCVEPWVTVEPFQGAENLEPYEEACMFLKSSFKPFEGRSRLVQARMNACQPERRDAIRFPISLNSLCKLAGLRVVTQCCIRHCGLQKQYVSISVKGER
jgi:hypothetical protein